MMPTRFDHAVIGVRDLAEALFTFQRLGFDARPGGRHTGGNTHNGLIRFGLDYVELLATYPGATEEQSGHKGPTIADLLGEREGGLLGYALATGTIEQDARSFIGDNDKAYKPRAMQRTRPDGRILSWRVYAPGENSWHQPWPFLIQWDIPDSLRLQIDHPGEHANGAIGVYRVAVVVKDLAHALDIYHNQLGLELIKDESEPLRDARRVTFGLGKTTIDLLTPNGEGSVQQTLTAAGEGPFALSFKTRDFNQTRDFFEEQEISFTYEHTDTRKILLDPSETLGVHLLFVE